jgi:hypothetical protein
LFMLLGQYGWCHCLFYCVSNLKILKTVAYHVSDQPVRNMLVRWWWRRCCLLNGRWLFVEWAMLVRCWWRRC